MAYFCLDCEASGPLPPDYNLLSIGVVVVRSTEVGHRTGASWYRELRPIFDGFDAGALAVCGLDPARLAVEGVPPKDALLELADWVRDEHGEDPGRPIFVGHNAVFDWAYVNHYFLYHGLENPFGYKGIDSKSLAMGVLGLSWEATSKEVLAPRLGLPPEDPRAKHRADYDAEYQARLLAALLDVLGPLDTVGGRF